jgi:signal transduction histidine kinase
MQLAKRFFVMNALTVIVSIALTALAFIIFVASYTSLFGIKASIHDLTRVYEKRSGIGQIHHAARNLSFDKLLEKSYQLELSDQLKAIGADAVILKNRKVLYSTQIFSEIEIEQSLMLSEHAGDIGTMELNTGTHLFARVDYHLPTREVGVLLLMAPIELNTGFYMSVGLFTAGFFLFSFLLLNLWVSYRFSRSIITPVSRLKAAAGQIRDGDLSRGIAEEGEGEVRELSRTLELMRIKLKESVYLQQKYDENRKFLISSISHDLKTPITSIKGYIEGVLDGVARTPEKIEEYLSIARSKSVMVNAMIDDLLLYSKLDLNQIPYHFERTDLGLYFEDCVSDNLYEFHKAGIQLSLICEWKETCYVSMDRGRFGRVVQNVLDNAKKCIDKTEGRVDIILRETRTSVIIEIRDNGKGIPENDLPHIFDRFYRADESRTSADGSGLGLAIAQQIVEGHGGKIWANSVVGEGSSMLISLKKLSHSVGVI